MISKTILSMLFISTSLFAKSGLPPQIIDDISVDNSRVALQDSAREVSLFIEQQRYQQLKKKQQQAEPVAPALNLPDSTLCLPITGVYLQGITLLSLNDLYTLSNLPEQCISSNDINRVILDLTHLYMQKGYITARVQILSPNHQGELGLSVIEGVVEKIIGGDRWANSRLLFPGLVSKPLKLDDLDQGLDQANRLQSNKTKIDILPGSLIGGSIIRIYNQHTKPWLISTTIDNYGQKSTGQSQARITATMDSPFGLSDFISLSSNYSLENPAHRFSRAYTMLYSLPYGAFTFSGFASISSYGIHQQLQHNVVNLHGQAQQYGLRGDYVFHRDHSHISSLSAQLLHKRIDNYFDNVRLMMSSPTLTLGELGASHLQIIPNGTLSVNISIDRNLPWFSNENSNNSVQFYNQFTKGKLFLNLNQRFVLSDAIFQLNNTFYGQFSRDPLPGVEWLNLTDRSAVRGFSRSTQSGDNGWYLQNTLSRSFDLGGATLTPRFGADIGRILPRQDNSGWRSSAGLISGVTFHFQQMLLDLEIARGRILSAHASIKEPIQMLSRFSYTF